MDPAEPRRDAARSTLRFRVTGQSTIRVPLLNRARVQDTWHLPARDTATADQLRDCAVDLSADPAFHEAVAVASPDLARAVALAQDPDRQTTLREQWKTTSALTRYLLRAATRSTPFGLFASVGLVDFGTPGDSGTTLALTAAERVKYVRPDRAWLAEQVRTWEAAATVHDALHVVANELLQRRGDRLVLPATSPTTGASAPAPPMRRTVRATRPLETALTLAREPIAVDLLTAQLLHRIPGASPTQVRDLIAQLIRLHVLLTDLNPPLHAADPLRHSRQRLPPQDTQAQSARERIDAVLDAFSRYRCAPPGQGLPALRAAARAAGCDRALHLDTTLQGRLVLPRSVTEDLEQAAAVLWRLAPRNERLASYHRAFLDRYGMHTAVPLLELLDPVTGLGTPTGDRSLPDATHQATPPARPPAHTRLVAYLAALNSRTGTHELELSDELLAACQVDEDGAPGRPGDSIEVYANLVAQSWDALRRGEYRLLLPPHAGTLRAGASFGRFAHAFPTADARPTTDPHLRPSPLQVTHPVLVDRMANVAQSPVTAVHHLALGAYPHPAPDPPLRTDDIDISADARHFTIHSRSLNLELDPFVPHLLNRHRGMPSQVRFLLEATAHGHKQWLPWDWGALEHAPHLPALHRGRVVLSPERWLLSPSCLADPQTDGGVWRKALARWREEWSVPDHVRVGAGDQHIALNLGIAGHQDLLREELRRAPTGVALQPAPYGDAVDAGWLRGPCGAYEAELVVPLAAVPSPRATTAPTQRPLPARATPSPVHIPGGSWLYAQLDCAPEDQAELLAGHLPELTDACDRHGVTWFFIRYPDPRPHLRLRFHGAPTTLHDTVLPRLHEVCRAWERTGLVSDMKLVPYRPETQRYGGPSALPLAHEVFAHDSRRTMELLRHTDRRNHADQPTPIAVAADGLVRMARAFLSAGGRPWTPWLATYRPSPPHSRGAEHRRHTREATALTRMPADRARQGDTPWEQAISNYGSQLHARSSASAWPQPEHCLESIMHMHCNRLLGADPTAERDAHAVARDIARAQLSRSTETS